MKFYLSDDELLALRGLPHLAQLIYLLELRPNMDFATGIVGGCKRRISWQGIAEAVNVLPSQGSAAVRHNKNQLRRAVAWLEDAGLVEQQNEARYIVFKLLLADSDQSVRKNPGPRPDHVRTTYTEPRPDHATYCSTNENDEQDAELRTTGQDEKTPNPGLHPISGIRNTKESTTERAQQTVANATARSHGSRLTLDALPETWRTWAKINRPDLSPDATFESFRDYWIAMPGAKGRKIDWEATWRNWVRRENAGRKPMACKEPGIVPDVRAEFLAGSQAGKTLDGECRRVA